MATAVGFSSTARRPPSVPVQPMETTMTIAVPSGAKPGSLIQATTPSGQVIQVTVPPGVTEGMQIKVSVPQSNPLIAVPVVTQPGQQQQQQQQQYQTSPYGEATIIKQDWAWQELFGWETKNIYRGYPSSLDPGARSPVGSPSIFVHEESDCFERQYCGPQRSLTLMARLGQNKRDPLLLSMYKPCHCQANLCCLRPTMTISDGASRPLGRIDDPFACFQINQRVLNAQDEERFYVQGSCCQPGLIWPCCDVSFGIKSVATGSKGRIQKIFDGFGECYLNTNRFKIDYPPDATEEDKALLFASAMLLDLQYFEKNKR